jgi:hypothetical protein
VAPADATTVKALPATSTAANTTSRVRMKFNSSR